MASSGPAAALHLPAGEQDPSEVITFLADLGGAPDGFVRGMEQFATSRQALGSAALRRALEQLAPACSGVPAGG